MNVPDVIVIPQVGVNSLERFQRVVDIWYRDPTTSEESAQNDCQFLMKVSSDTDGILEEGENLRSIQILIRKAEVLNQGRFLEEGDKFLEEIFVGSENDKASVDEVMSDGSGFDNGHWGLR